MIRKFNLNQVSNLRKYKKETVPKINLSTMILHTGTVASLYLVFLGFIYFQTESLRKEFKENINSISQDIHSFKQESIKKNSIRKEIDLFRQDIDTFRQEMSSGFDSINERLDTIINSKNKSLLNCNTFIFNTIFCQVKPGFDSSTLYRKIKVYCLIP
jgi:hypothetical protein